MTTFDLFNTMLAGCGVGSPCVYVFDKTGMVDFGSFYKGKDSLPTWLKYVNVRSFTASDNTLWIKLNDFRGDLQTRNDDISVKVLGFDYIKGDGFFDKYTPDYIIVEVNHIARCEKKVKHLKVTPDSYAGYTFKIYGKKYSMRDVIRY